MTAMPEYTMDRECPMRAGTVISCPECKLDIAVCLVDQVRYKTVVANGFKVLGDWDLAGYMWCPKCGARYGGMIGGRFLVHTTSGWVA